MFKRTSLPVARSIHYQLIDIQLDEVQQMVHSNDEQVNEGRKGTIFLCMRKKENLFHDRRICFLLPLVDKHTCQILIRKLREKGKRTIFEYIQTNQRLI